jgi:hypothetical protein
MELKSLGYIGIQSAQLENWTNLAIRLLGMQEVDRGGRCDEFGTVVHNAVRARALNEDAIFARTLERLTARLEKSFPRTAAAKYPLRRISGLVRMPHPALPDRPGNA